MAKKKEQCPSCKKYFVTLENHKCKEPCPKCKNPKFQCTCGAPRKEINQEQFEALCRIQCTQEEIAGFFNMSIETLSARVRELYENRSFLEVFNEKREHGKASLRRKQWQRAESDDTTMLIFLGKQYLGQAEKNMNEIKNSAKLDDITKKLQDIADE